jgi:hypothetical protein
LPFDISKKENWSIMKNQSNHQLSQIEPLPDEPVAAQQLWIPTDSENLWFWCETKAGGGASEQVRALSTVA